MKVLMFHLTGNANVKSAAYGLVKASMLAEFHVSIATIPGGMLDKLGGFKLLSELRRRRFDPILKPYIRIWPWMELGRIISLKFGLKFLTNKKSALFCIDNVVQNLDKKVSESLENLCKYGVNAVYGYEDTTLSTFKKAKTLDMLCIYDLPIGYWRAAHKFLEVERITHPEWLTTMTGLYDSPEKLSNKDEELRLADRIFVASSFTAKTLQDFPGMIAPVEVIPYGFPEVNDEIRIYPDFKTKRTLKLLFVGSLSQRKGIVNLFEAVKDFKNEIELTLVGNKVSDDCPALDNELRLHKWIPSMSHDEVLKLMRESDILVFPSLFEGFGLVITEAMSQGTPVITTERTAGPDLIDHGRNGWLIKAGSTIALKDTIQFILQNPECIEVVGKAAMDKARSRPWGKYGEELAKSIAGIRDFSNTN